MNITPDVLHKLAKKRYNECLSSFHDDLVIAHMRDCQLEMISEILIYGEPIDPASWFGCLAGIIKRGEIFYRRLVKQYDPERLKERARKSREALAARRSFGGGGASGGEGPTSESIAPVGESVGHTCPRSCREGCNQKGFSHGDCPKNDDGEELSRAA